MIELAAETITFEEAIAFTQSLLEGMETLTEKEKQQAIASLVQSENGARGFFVTYLTDERDFADLPSLGLLEALKQSPEIVSELLVKNIAMSTAMAITHRRNQNWEMEQKSIRVTKRSLNLCRQLPSEQITTKSKQLAETIQSGEGIYREFLSRWHYDGEQREAILNQISCLG